MTDETLSRWICDKFEPVGALEPMPSGREAREAFPDISPQGFWRLATRPEWRWQPRDMVSNAAMTVMLLEKSAFVSLDLDEGVYHALFCASEVHTLACCPASSATHSTLGRAIAEAWAIANGLAASELEGK